MRGESPSAIPFEAFAGTKLIVNLDAAKAAGLTVPADILARADEVIGRWDGGAFMVALAAADREEAVRRVRTVLEKLRSEGVRTDDGQRLSASFAAGS